MNQVLSVDGRVAWNREDIPLNKDGQVHDLPIGSIQLPADSTWLIFGGLLGEVAAGQPEDSEIVVGQKIENGSYRARATPVFTSVDGNFGAWPPVQGQSWEEYCVQPDDPNHVTTLADYPVALWISVGSRRIKLSWNYLWYNPGSHPDSAYDPILPAGNIWIRFVRVDI